MSTELVKNSTQIAILQQDTAIFKNLTPAQKGILVGISYEMIAKTIRFHGKSPEAKEWSEMVLDRISEYTVDYSLNNLAEFLDMFEKKQIKIEKQEDVFGLSPAWILLHWEAYLQILVDRREVCRNVFTITVFTPEQETEIKKSFSLSKVEIHREPILETTTATSLIDFTNPYWLNDLKNAWQYLQPETQAKLMEIEEVKQWKAQQ